MTDYYVATGNDDYYTDSTAGTQYTTATIAAGVNNSVTPTRNKAAYAKIDTSGIPDTNTVSAATVSFNENAYTATKGVAKIYTLQMWDGSNYVTVISYMWTASGTVKTYTLNSTQRNYVSKTGYTKWRITVDDPGGTSYRDATFNAYETSQATAFRMSITHSAASSSYYNVTICTT